MRDYLILILTFHPSQYALYSKNAVIKKELDFKKKS